MNLVSRLYDADSGSVCVGGKDVRQYDMETLRNQVAVVLQKNVLFSGTILDNLRWGKEDARKKNVKMPAVRPAPMNSSNGFQMGTRPGLSREVPMYPAARSSGSALPAPC